MPSSASNSTRTSPGRSITKLAPCYRASFRFYQSRSQVWHQARRMSASMKTTCSLIAAGEPVLQIRAKCRSGIRAFKNCLAFDPIRASWVMLASSRMLSLVFSHRWPMLPCRLKRLGSLRTVSLPLTPELLQCCNMKSPEPANWHRLWDQRKANLSSRWPVRSAEPSTSKCHSLSFDSWSAATRRWSKTALWSSGWKS